MKWRRDWERLEEKKRKRERDQTKENEECERDLAENDRERKEGESDYFRERVRTVGDVRIWMKVLKWDVC